MLSEASGKRAASPQRGRRCGFRDQESYQGGTSLQFKDSRLIANIYIKGRRWSATVDTGATKCFVSESCAHTIDPRGIVSSDNIAICLADSSRRQINQILRAEVIFGKCRLNIQFLVLPDASEDIILGLDFLLRNQTQITCAGLSCDLPAPEEAKMSSLGCRNITITSKQSQSDKDNSRRSMEALKQNSFPTVGVTSTENQQKINTFLNEELNKFKHLHGVSTIATHRIVMKDDRPFKLRYAARNPAMQAIIHEKVNELLAKGFIEPSRSPYNSSITLARKKNGTWRLYMDRLLFNERSTR